MKKLYLNVPYTDKEKAKSFGVKWDATRKQWYLLLTDNHVSLNHVRKWMISDNGIFWLDVSDKDRQTVFHLGAQIDEKTRKWYIERNIKSSINLFRIWLSTGVVYETETEKNT